MFLQPGKQLRVPDQSIFYDFRDARGVLPARWVVDSKRCVMAFGSILQALVLSHVQYNPMVSISWQEHGRNINLEKGSG